MKADVPASDGLGYSALAALDQHIPQLGDRTRLADQIALRLRAALAAQHVELLGGLDAFRGRDHTEAPPQARDGPNDRERIVARRKLAHERAIDLDLVEREAAQIAQRGIAGAEIVERDLDAELAQLEQHLARRLAALQQHGFGDLELEPPRRQAGLHESRFHAP